MDNLKIGKFVTESRKAKNLTQQELADKLCVTVQAVSKWECGKGLPEISIMKTLCENLGVSINELLNGEKIAEKDIATKADEQLVNQLVDKKNENIKQRILKFAFSTVFAFILPMMIIAQRFDDAVARILFNVVCIFVMSVCIAVIVALGIKSNCKLR